MKPNLTPLTADQAALVGEYYPLAVRLARRVARRAGAPADDVVGEGGMVLVAIARRYDPARGPFLPFLLLTFEEGLWKRLARAGRRVGSPGRLAGDGPAVRDRPEARDAPACLARVRALCAEAEWLLLWRRYAEGGRVREIAAAAGLTPRAVSRRVWALKSRLRTRLPHLVEEFRHERRARHG